jgi:CRISPR system Cascade subunit CasA
MMNKFNLAENSWIPCLMRETNETKDLSLFEVLSKAQDIKEIVDNSPLIVVALHRLLLAILHRNFGPENYDEWKNLWKQECWNAETLRAYFAKNKDRFNLFDEERPFYQYPNVTKKDGNEADILPIETLMQEKATGNNATLFDHSFEAGSKSVLPAVAARYLVARHSFSFAGGVSFPFNFSNGLLVSGFSVLATGKNLFETLALNLVIYDRRNKPFSTKSNDAPFWERSELIQASERDRTGISANGYLDYLTWQSRRIRLVFDEETQTIKGCQLQQNFKLSEEPKIFDPFKVYVAGENGFYPMGLREDKSLWRNSHTLLQQAQQKINDKSLSSLFSHLANVENMMIDGEVKGVANHSFSIFGVINDKANVKL